MMCLLFGCLEKYQKALLCFNGLRREGDNFVDLCTIRAGRESFIASIALFVFDHLLINCALVCWRCSDICRLLRAEIGGGRMGEMHVCACCFGIGRARR